MREGQSSIASMWRLQKTPVSSSTEHNHPSHICDADIWTLTSTSHTSLRLDAFKSIRWGQSTTDECLSADIYNRVQSLKMIIPCASWYWELPTLTSPFICRRHNHISGRYHKANNSSVLCPKAKNSFLGWFCLCTTNYEFTRSFDSPFHRQQEHF